MNHQPSLKAVTRVRIIALLLAVVTGAAAQTVTFPDASLEDAVRNALLKPSGDITEADMLTLTNLDAGYRNIGDTSGLETARNLGVLDFSGNAVTNFSGFTGLTNLDRLTWVWSSLSNLTFATSLPTLRTLILYGNHFQDVSPLLSLANIEYLQLDWNAEVTNLTLVSALTNLTYLSLEGSGVSNISFVASLSRLQSLGLYLDAVKDISPLAGLTNLTTLGLGWNGVTNPAVLAEMPQLAILALNGNSLTNVPYLAGLTNLTDLALDYTQLTDMSPLTNLARLAILNVGENFLTGYPDLSTLTNLIVFMTAGNQIADLSPLTNLPALRNLHLQRNLFHDVSPLAHRPGLDTLLLSGNTITDLAPLMALTNLGVLQLGNMGLTSLAPLAPLAALPGLWHLDLYDNLITDLSPLASFPALGFLSVELNRLQQIDPLLNIPSLWYANLRQNALDTNATSAAWQVITNLQARTVFVEYDPQFPLPAPIQILAPPANRSAFVGDNLVFSVSATGGTPGLSYRWKKDGVDLADDARIYGTDSDSLHIDNISVGDSGKYRVRVWDDWMVTNSLAAELLIITNVVFTDPNLEQAVRAAVGIYTDPLTPGDLVGLTSLNASHTYWEITNLEGLEAAANLEDLDLSGQITLQSLAPLRFLSRLRSLRLNHCELDNLEFVSDLPTLTALEVSGNFIEDLSPLIRQPGLEHLALDENQLTQISPLLELPALIEVYLWSNRLDTNETSAAWNVITNLQGRPSLVYVEYDPQFPAPVRPVIVTQPAAVVAYLGDNIYFSVVATSIAPALNFRWQRNGVNLTDGPDRWGTDSDMLHLDNVDTSAPGSYRVRVWDENGVTNSLVVALHLITNVAFVDPQLELAVRNQLGIPVAPLTPADLAPMTWLESRNYGLTNLSGLESAVNLEFLTLSYNPGLTDYTPLTALPRLKYLDLNACAVSDIAFVAALPPLDELHLWSGSITDLSPLVTQPQLRKLNLAYHSSITNFTVLNTLTNLEELALEGTGISDISFAAFMPNLYNASFQGCAVHDLSPVSGATHLTWLDMANNQITNAAPLASCTNLQWLSAGGNQIADLDFVAQLPKLWLLAVNNNALTNISGLTGRTNITWLDLGWNPIPDLAPLATLTWLKDLNAWNLGLSNVNFLVALTNLQVFNAGRNAITTLPLSPGLNHLVQLNLEENPLANLDFIAGMTSLHNLQLSRTGVQNLSLLSGCTNLHNLGLDQNGISDISPLAMLSNLGWVSLYGNNLQDITALSGLTNLDYVDLRLNRLDISSGSAALLAIQTLQGLGAYVAYVPQQNILPPVTLSAPTWLGGDQFRFDLTSAPGAVLQIWISTTLDTWSSAGFVTNITGTTNFTDSAVTTERKFYRAQQQ